jgi:hypothetical protein
MLTLLCSQEATRILNFEIPISCPDYCARLIASGALQLKPASRTQLGSAIVNRSSWAAAGIV